MHRSGILVLLGVSIVAMAATGASAQNLLVNPDFDTDVTTGWSGIGVWDPNDVFGSPTSGSATWINTWASGGAIYHTQCVEGIGICFYTPSSVPRMPNPNPL